jgi:FKBP-type peptidyl-prolyl cis-trans isomerase FklB
MIKKIYLLPVLLLSIVAFLPSCMGDDELPLIDEAWKLRNVNEFNKEAALDGIYNTIQGIADTEQSILWKQSDFWEGSAVTDPNERNGMRSAIFSDTVKVRYDGWFLDNNGKPIIFDSTERPTSFSPNSNPNKVARIMRVSDLIDGWRIALYEMKEGDEWRIVVPYQLGYGDMEYNNIPPCTTLYFDLKLVEIVSKSN